MLQAFGWFGLVAYIVDLVFLVRLFLANRKSGNGGAAASGAESGAAAKYWDTLRCQGLDILLNDTVLFVWVREKLACVCHYLLDCSLLISVIWLSLLFHCLVAKLWASFSEFYVLSDTLFLLLY